ncbi:carbon storage regulator [Maioricimonas rarisocia]|uniref:Carbon storage regulator n=1 Tax=Maioricimonas rarisocia TaxID=2528026 RepID=A0A517Z8X2_9PLAN|nr:carbon storage regulator [Maioricimonas rarisocia]QDU38906.1 carbon storage regulator [Maioricimonas rarisocia]
MRDIDCGIDDTIAIGEVTITVLDIEGNEVRLGISSPEEGIDYREVVLQVGESCRPHAMDLAAAVCLN